MDGSAWISIDYGLAVDTEGMIEMLASSVPSQLKLVDTKCDDGTVTHTFSVPDPNGKPRHKESCADLALEMEGYIYAQAGAMYSDVYAEFDRDKDRPQCHSYCDSVYAWAMVGCGAVGVATGGCCMRCVRDRSMAIRSLAL